jgi:hypothetical protein
MELVLGHSSEPVQAVSHAILTDQRTLSVLPIQSSISPDVARRVRVVEETQAIPRFVVIDE